MTPEISRIEKSRESVRRWYAAHREEYAELRRQRYQRNSKLRVKARRAAAQYRMERQAGRKITRVLYRVLNGERIEAFTSGYVADRVGVSAQVLRGWEDRGWIPESVFKKDKHRLYTARQMALIKLLADALKSGPKARKDPELLDEVINVIHKTWKDHGNQSRQKARRS